MTEIFDGVPNSRGVAGLPLVGGGCTRDGVLYRSSALDGITQQGLDELSASPIGIVADLRTPMERDMSVDKLPQLRHIESVDLSIAVGNMSPRASGSAPELKNHLEQDVVGAAEHLLPHLGELYEMMLKEAADQFAQVAGLVAQVESGANNAVLIHCTAGKDRTGISTALILDAVGVQRDSVVKNYAESQQNLAGPWADGMLAKLKAAGIPLKPRLVALVTTTPPKAIETALNWVDKHHGSSANYLQHGGLSGAQINQLKQVLT